MYSNGSAGGGPGVVVVRNYSIPNRWVAGSARISVCGWDVGPHGGGNKNSKKPLSSRDFLAREYAAGKQGLSYILACQLGLADPEKMRYSQYGERS